MRAFARCDEAPSDLTLRRDVLSTIQNCLAWTNPFVRAYESDARSIRDDDTVTRVADPIGVRYEPLHL